MDVSQDAARRRELADRASRSMGQCYRRVFAYASRELAPDGYGRGKQLVLRILSERDGLSLAGIADAGALDRGNVTRIVASLESDGYLRRESDPAARHGYRVFLTERGREAALRVREVLDSWDDGLYAALDDDGLAELAHVLEDLAARSDSLWKRYLEGGDPRTC